MNRFIFIIFCFSFSYAQWISLNLDSANETDQVKTFLTGVSLSFGHHTRAIQEQEQRLVAGVSFVYAKNLSKSAFNDNYLGGIPIFYGRILISDNLFFQGKLSGFTSGGDISQQIGWGFILNLSDINDHSSWKLSTNFSHVKSPGNLNLRGLDVFLSKEWKIGNIWWYLGLGKNYYKTRIYSNNDSIPSVLERENNYIQIGTQLRSTSYVFVPQLKFHPEIVQISVDVIRGFH
tara:strand:+ start:63 stop:761 length:699 start_codon:yes stop_codon:yes gene_type:complete